MDDQELERTLHVTNISSILSQDQLRQLFAFCGTVGKCEFLTDDKSIAHVRFNKPDEAKAALALNNMAVGDKQLKVELAKTLKSARQALIAATTPAAAPVATPTAAPSLPTGLPAGFPGFQSIPGMPAGMQLPGSFAGAAAGQLPLSVQQAMAMPMMQYQQALVMQQAIAAQAKTSEAKSAAELAAKRAKEISKVLAGGGGAAGGAAEKDKGEGKEKASEDK